MKNTVKKLSLFLACLMMLTIPANATAELEDIKMDVDEGNVDETIFMEDGTDYAIMTEISAPSAILLEKETGKVIYEKNADEKLLPASVTKVMTILLIVEAVEAKNLSLEDVVTTSTYASSMGGSQVYLKEGEQMSVHEMLKCIVVSSANDAAVAVAEHIAGSEASFSELMNRRAAELGMTNTHFTNCTGLLESNEHYTTARDIAIMSAELIKHEWIKEYTTIWMDTIRNGEFGLSNTNKLIYYYSGSTGLKTGFTRKAGYCLSATAEKDGMELIAVVMNCASSNDRFESAKIMLNYGFANYTIIDKLPEENEMSVKVRLGTEKSVKVIPEESGKLLIPKTSANLISKTVTLSEEEAAPIMQGQKLGTLTISDGTDTIAEISLVAETSIEKLTWVDMFIRLFKITFIGIE